MRGLLAALGFLTRLPLPAHAAGDQRAWAHSLPWYPLVGGLIGVILCGLAWCLRAAPPLLSAALVVAAWVVLTGALHLDGLADTADAWTGGLGDRERTLAIMKDPRCGPSGVVSLVLLLLLKTVALGSVPAVPWAALLLAPLLARAALTALFLSTPYVRSAGLGTALAQAPRLACRLALAATAAACLLAGRRGLLALASAVVVFALWRRACRRRLGGFTGDTAGALAEMVELAVVLVLTWA